MLERKVSLVVDSHQCEVVKMELGVQQGLSVSSIWFAVYLSEIFKEREEWVEGCMSK